jgi:hypothetical protein
MDFDYHLENVNDRLLQLHQVLEFDSECKENKKLGYLSYYQRMLICQERSAMMSFKNYLFKEIQYSGINWYRVPQELETIIIQIKNKINLKIQ